MSAHVSRSANVRRIDACLDQHRALAFSLNNSYEAVAKWAEFHGASDFATSVQGFRYQQALLQQASIYGSLCRSVYRTAERNLDMEAIVTRLGECESALHDGFPSEAHKSLMRLDWRLYSPNCEYQHQLAATEAGRTATAAAGDISRLFWLNSADDAPQIRFDPSTGRLSVCGTATIVNTQEQISRANELVEILNSADSGEVRSTYHLDPDHSFARLATLKQIQKTSAWVQNLLESYVAEERAVRAPEGTDAAVTQPSAPV